MGLHGSLGQGMRFLLRSIAFRFGVSTGDATISGPAWDSLVRKGLGSEGIGSRAGYSGVVKRLPEQNRAEFFYSLRYSSLI